MQVFLLLAMTQNYSCHVQRLLMQFKMADLKIGCLILLFLLSYSLSDVDVGEVVAPPCGGYYDCNFYFDYFTSIASLTSCMEKCKSSCRCGHFSYNYNSSGPFFGHCYLSYSCQDPQSSRGEWVSGPKVCKEHRLGNSTYYYSPHNGRLAALNEN